MTNQPTDPRVDPRREHGHCGQCGQRLHLCAHGKPAVPGWEDHACDKCACEEARRVAEEVLRGH